MADSPSSYGAEDIQVLEGLEAVRKRLEERPARVGPRLDEPSVLRLREDDVPLRRGGIDPERRAEAGLGGAAAGHREDQPVLAAVFVIRIDRLREEDLVEDPEGTRVAGTDAEHGKVLVLRARIENLDLFVLHAEADEVFRLREEEVLRAPRGFESLRDDGPGPVSPVRALVRLDVDRDVERAAL